MMTSVTTVILPSRALILPLPLLVQMNSAYVSCDNNTDADITLGDYTVLAADSSDTSVEMYVCDNDGSTVTLGDVKLESTNYVDLYVCDNDNATITLGDVTLEQLSTGGDTGSIDIDLKGNTTVSSTWTISPPLTRLAMSRCMCNRQRRRQLRRFGHHG